MLSVSNIQLGSRWQRVRNEIDDARKDLPSRTLDELAKASFTLLNDPIPGVSDDSASFCSQPNCRRSSIPTHERSVGTTVINEADMCSQQSQASSFAFGNSVTTSFPDPLPPHSDEHEENAIPDMMYGDQVSHRRSSLSGSMGALKGMR